MVTFGLGLIPNHLTFLPKSGSSTFMHCNLTRSFTPFPYTQINPRIRLLLPCVGVGLFEGSVVVLVSYEGLCLLHELSGNIILQVKIRQEYLL